MVLNLKRRMYNSFFLSTNSVLNYSVTVVVCIAIGETQTIALNTYDIEEVTTTNTLLSVRLIAIGCYKQYAHAPVNQLYRCLLVTENSASIENGDYNSHCSLNIFRQWIAVNVCLWN